MEIMAFASGKGGTGKTLMASCLGYSLIKAGHRVLLLDSDYATDGLSLFLLGREGTRHITNFEESNTFAGALHRFGETGSMIFEPRRINRSASNELGGHGISYEAIISGKDLYGDELILAKGPPVPDLDQKTFREAVRHLFENVRESDRYDYVLVDTRGGFAFETTDICALCDSFIVITEPDFTSFYQDRNLVKWISAAATQLGSRPLLRSIIVNKATEGEQPDGRLDLGKIEASFRLELIREFPLKFEDTHPVPVDIEALKAYKTQRIPYLTAPASLFSFATLSAFGDILQVVTAKWRDDQVQNWNLLVDTVSRAIADRNNQLSREREQQLSRERELIELRNQNDTLGERVEELKRDIQRVEKQYERELARANTTISLIGWFKSLSVWKRLAVIYLLVATIVTVPFISQYYTSRLAERSSLARISHQG